MKSRVFKIQITPIAGDSFRKIILQIKKNSPANAKRIRLEISSRIKDLRTFPRRYHKEPSLLYNPSEIRSFTMYNIKTLYKIEGTVVYVLDIIHGKSNPDDISILE